MTGVEGRSPEATAELPCPWCGSAALPSVHWLPGLSPDGADWRLTCRDCSASSPSRDTREAAIEAWNTRNAARLGETPKP